MASKPAERGSSPRAGGERGLTAKQFLGRIKQGKLARRRALAALPFEAKFRMVMEMNALSREASRASSKPAAAKPSDEHKAGEALASRRRSR